jgi:hypothetical protein
MKVCKTYCTYFGERRGIESAGPSNATETLSIFKNNINHDLLFNHGVGNMDIIVINNESQTITQECTDYLNEINNMVTPFGEIKVIHRENKGGSLGAYSHAFDIFIDDYDYWLFVEDDLKLIYPNYYQMIIDEFKDEKLGFLALTLINNENNINTKHVSGGFGASKTTILKKIKEKYGKLPYDEGNNLTNYGGFGQSEMYFTNCYHTIGYDVRIPNNNEVITLADNWVDFPPHVMWQQIKNFDLSKNFLIHIGY